MSCSVFDVKFKTHDNIENLYEFCKFFEDMIVGIIYCVKYKRYEIYLEGDGDTRKIIDIPLRKVESIFKNLIIYEDFCVSFTQDEYFNEHEDLLNDLFVSSKNPTIYLYYNKIEKRFKIDCIPKIIFEILDKFKISDLEEIIYLHKLFSENLKNKTHALYFDSCIKRYYNEEYKTINIKINDITKMKISGNFKYYINRNYRINNSYVHSFNNSYTNVKRIADNDFILSDINLNNFFSEKENPIIKNNIFNNNEEEDYDEEYTEIIRSRRIKKIFTISINN